MGLFSKCYTDINGNVINHSIIGKEIYLVIESKNLVGKKIDIDLSDNTKDFEYKGKRLENDILSDVTITKNIQRVKLKVITPQKQ